MPQVTFVLPAGRRITAEARAGATLLDVARAERIAIEGACVGCMACATCHVIVEEAWFDRLEPPSAEEEDMLELAESLAATSRLGCQIVMDGGLDGLVVEVPRTSLLE